LGVYRVHGTTNEKFVVNVVQVEIQRHHLYIIRHAARVANATNAYSTKHKIVDNDMV
jgi:hypothetical protein